MLPLIPVGIVAGVAVAWRRFYPTAQDGVDPAGQDPSPDPSLVLAKSSFSLPSFGEMMRMARTGDLRPLCAIVDEQADVAVRLGYSLPPGWGNWACEVKIIFAAPVGIGEAIVGAAKAVQLWNATLAKPAAKASEWVGRQARGGLETTAANATHTNTTVGTHGTTIAGHRIF